LAGPDPAGLSFRAFVHGLRALGYVEGQTFSAGAPVGRGSAAASTGSAELLFNVDVIVTASDTMTRAARTASTIPIVMTLGGIQWPRARSGLARPGRAHGLTFQVGPEIDAKRLQLLREMLPGASRIAFLANKEEGSWETPAGKSVRATAQAMALTLVRVEASRNGYIDALAQVGLARVDALFVGRSSHAYFHRLQIIDFTTATGCPAASTPAISRTWRPHVLRREPCHQSRARRRLRRTDPQGRAPW
jgi:putative ABC transport system substrate-binding protein